MSKGGKVQETAQQQALAQHAMNLMQDYRQRWEPLQMHLAGQIEAEGAPGSTAQKLAEGRSTADVQQAFAQSQGALQKAMSDTGAGGSSKAKLGAAEMGLDQAKSRGLGGMIADQQIQDAYTEGLGALMSLGQGKSATVGNSLAKQAAFSGSQAAADAQASLMQSEGRAQLAGQALGAAGYGVMSSMAPPVSGQYSSMATPDYSGTNGGFGWKGGTGGM